MPVAWTFGRPLIPAVSAATMAVAAAAAKSPAQERDLKICAAWDVHIATQIEDSGRLAMVAPIDLADAALARMRAWALCASGQAKEATEIYGRIDLAP